MLKNESKVAGIEEKGKIPTVLLLAEPCGVDATRSFCGRNRRMPLHFWRTIPPELLRFSLRPEIGIWIV